MSICLFVTGNLYCDRTLGYVANEMLDSLPLGETQNFFKKGSSEFTSLFCGSRESLSIILPCSIGWAMGTLSTANSNSVFSMSASLAKVFQNLGSLLYFCFRGHPKSGFSFNYAKFPHNTSNNAHFWSLLTYLHPKWVPWGKTEFQQPLVEMWSDFSGRRSCRKVESVKWVSWEVWKWDEAHKDEVW